jgi:hypothetical protein
MYSISSSGDRIRCGPPDWGLGKGLTTPHHNKSGCYRVLHRELDLDRDQLRGHVNTVKNFRVP